MGHKLEVELKPEQIADLWCELSAKEQSLFFNKLFDNIDEDWGGLKYLTDQIKNIVECGELTPGGKQVLKTIGDVGITSNLDIPKLEGSYFVGSDGDEPNQLYFSVKDAQESQHQYLDSFSAGGTHLKTYKYDYSKGQYSNGF